MYWIVFLNCAVVVLVSGRPSLDGKISETADNQAPSKPNMDTRIETPTTESKIPNGAKIRLLKSHEILSSMPPVTIKVAQTTKTTASERRQIFVSSTVGSTVSTVVSCFHKGVGHIPRCSESPQDANLCCDENGKTVKVERKSAKTHTPETKTSKNQRPVTNAPFTASPTHTRNRKGCLYKGKLYPLRKDIKIKLWPVCVGFYCDSHGNLIPWKRFGCRRSTSKPAFTRSTRPHRPRTEIPTTLRNISYCFFEGGWYRPGDEILRGDDECSGKYCGDNGQVISWDECDDTIGPTRPRGCLYFGKWYKLGSDISRGYDGSSWCSGVYCSYDGKVIVWDNFKCSTTTTTPITTIPTTSTTTTTTDPTTIPERLTTLPTPKGCYYNGRWFPPNTEISRGSSYGWCYGTVCDAEGNVLLWDDWRCSTTTRPTTTPFPSSKEPTTIPTTSTTTTTTDPTTIPERLTTLPSPTRKGCYYNGRWFPPNTEISRGSSYGWCYGTVCDAEGNVLSWDDWRCSTTTRPTTTPVPSSKEPTTIPTGCNYNGLLYNLRSEIFQSWNGNGKCYGTRCSDDGQIIKWHDYKCEALPEVETVQSNAKDSGCWYGGHLYHYGSEIFRKTPSGKCFEGTCDKSGIKNWKALSCQDERQFLAGSIRSRWCSYRGQLYPRGSIVYSRSLYKSRGDGWCVGAKCGKNGRIIAWGPAWAPGYC